MLAVHQLEMKFYWENEIRIRSPGTRYGSPSRFRPTGYGSGGAEEVLQINFTGGIKRDEN